MALGRFFLLLGTVVIGKWLVNDRKRNDMNFCAVALQENCKEDDESCQIGPMQFCATKIRKNNRLFLLVGDVNRDGVLENDERLAMRLKMRDLFDIDESGSVDTDEIRGVSDLSRSIALALLTLIRHWVQKRTYLVSTLAWMLTRIRRYRAKKSITDGKSSDPN